MESQLSGKNCEWGSALQLFFSLQVNAPIAGCERDYGWRFKLDAGFAGSGREKLQVVTLW